MNLSLESLTDLAGLKAALAEAGLPAADIGEAGRQFWCCRAATGAIIGYVGLEAYGADALLRSVVVLPTYRGNGYGQTIVDLTRTEAMKIGVDRLWLLTLSAEAFFTGLGFGHVERTTAPARIAESQEFESLCPGTAICMRADITD
jgi:amino-acid N-acetyltransferase